MRKSFVCMRPPKDEQESRSAALLKLLGMSNRIVTPETPVDEIVSILNKPYPNDIDGKIEELRNHSLEWLRDAIIKV